MSLKIIWAEQAVEAVRHIFNYYKDKSPQGARNVLDDLLEAPKTIHFAKQYQLDDINPKYRRIVVRDYKILYQVVDEAIYVMDVISTRQSPDVLKDK